MRNEEDDEMMLKNLHNFEKWKISMKNVDSFNSSIAQVAKTLA